jgi:hypothetical protein
MVAVSSLTAAAVVLVHRHLQRKMRPPVLE